MDKWFRRLLAWVWAVTQHSYAVVGTIAGSTFVLALPWIVSHLLPEPVSERLVLAQNLPTHIYHLLSFAILLVGLLYASFLAWNEERDLFEASAKSQRSVEQELLDKTRPQFVAEITEVFINGDHAQPDWVKLYIFLTIRNQGAESSVDRWILKVVPPQPAGPFIQTDKGLLSESQQGRGGVMGGNLLHDREIIARGGGKEGWLLCHGPKNRIGLTTGQRPRVKVSFKDVHDKEWFAVDPPHCDVDAFFNV
jgi:hypothetical protein